MLSCSVLIEPHRSTTQAWSIVVPWIGFPLRKLLALAKPLPNATHLRMESFYTRNASVMLGVAQSPGGLGGATWPYVEAMTVPEARVQRREEQLPLFGLIYTSF